MPAQTGEPLTGHRPHLDGLRALAVYLVVAFHAGAARAGGGFIGVDVFFVLSGYLVTSVLLRDLDGADHRLRWGRFYSRRVRRLLPAAAVNLIVTAIVFATIAAPVELAAAQQAIRAAALYVSNWYFIGESAQYFGADVDASPVLQYWSLSVEEQFYLLWPLLLGGIYWVSRRARSHQMWVARAIIAVGGLASLAAALRLATTNLDRAYYGTDTRAYQLLAGAFLAITPGIVLRARRSRLVRVLPMASIVAMAGLVVLASSLVTVNPIGRGVLATILTCGLVVSLDGATGGVGRALLSWAPVAYLGRISYGTYLWHWLVIVVLAREAELSPLATVAVAAVVATGLASLSYQVLENPVRTTPALDRRARGVIAAGLAVSLLVGLVATPRLLDRGSGGGAASALQTSEVDADTVSSELPTGTEIGDAFFEPSYYGDCEVSGPVACLMTPGSGQTAIVVGESHAGMWTSMLGELAQEHDLRLMGGYLSYCPWTKGIRYAKVGPDCLADQADMFDRIIPELDPDIVFLAHRPVDDADNSLAMRDLDAGHLEPGPALEAALGRRITDLVASLRADGRTVVMFEPVPVDAADRNSTTCLSEASAVEECRYVNPVTPTGEEETMRELAAADDGVVSVDVDPLVCPYLPICDPVVHGLIVKRDDNHLTQPFARSLREPIDEYLMSEGVLSPL